MARDRLIFLPLGGAGEIGMNCYVYGYGPPGRERLVVVDFGVAFPNPEMDFGIDLIVPNLDWLCANSGRIEGLFITHGHLDHIGAAFEFRRHLERVPIYVRPFSLDILRRGFDEHRVPMDRVVTVETRVPVEAGPFKVSYFPVSHSIPDSCGLIIDTPVGRVLHTGDFKLDRYPVVGNSYDPAQWSDIARNGLHALVCDSTNVFSLHAGRSESILKVPAGELVRGCEGAFVATTFASNVARVKTMLDVAQEVGRSVVLMGRTMEAMVKSAHMAGLLPSLPQIVDSPRDIPRDRLMVLVTGSQGERNSAGAQLSRGKFRGFSLGEGDTFLFSSTTIPGNERPVAAVKNALSERGVQVVDHSMGDYHVSGHANRPDLEEIQDLLRPRMIIPMHGEHRHLRRHMELARQRGFSSGMAVNGEALDISGESPEFCDQVPAERMYIEGGRLVASSESGVRQRRKIAENGLIAVWVLYDSETRHIEARPGIFGIARALTASLGSDADEVGHALTRALKEALNARVMRGEGDFESREAFEAFAVKSVRRFIERSLPVRPEIAVECFSSGDSA